VLSPVFDATTAYVVAVIFVATLIRSTLGFGEALVAVPLLSLAIPVTVAAPLAVSVSVIVALAIVMQDWRRIDVGSAGGLIVASLFGLPLGILLLTSADERLVKLVLGTVIILFSIYSLVTGSVRRLPGDSRLWLAACGFVGGILGGAYGMNGPPLVVYGTMRGWSPQQFRATLQGYFLPVSLAGLVGYAGVGLWDASVTRYFLWSLPSVAAATVLGHAINRRVNSDRFTQLVFGALLVIGAVLVVQAGVRS
jgi:uncharacterized membrane protein YfcA